MGDEGLVFRSGGQEFAVIVPGATHLEAATMAERLREVLEDAPIDPAVEAKAVKVSLGVAALEPEVRHLLTRPGLLRELANMSVEAAREAGGNCVRVFSPKPRPSSAA